MTGDNSEDIEVHHQFEARKAGMALDDLRRLTNSVRAPAWGPSTTSAQTEPVSESYRKSTTELSAAVRGA